MSAQRLQAYILLLTVSVIWGVAAPVIKYTLNYFPPLLFIVYRFAISSLLALFDFLWHPQILKNSDRNQLAVGAYALFAAPLTLGLLFLGIDKTESMTAQLVSIAAPLLVILLSAIIFREEITKRERIGALIAFSGALFTVAGPIFAGNGMGPEAGFGNLIILTAFIFDSVAALLSKYLMNRNHNPRFLSHLSFIVGFLVLLPLLLSYSHPLDIWSTVTNAPLSGHLGVLYMAVLSGTVAYALRTRAIAKIELSEATLFTYLNPLWGLPLAVFWLKESFDKWYLIGGFFIVAGIIIAETEKRRRKVSQKFKLRRRQKP